MIHRLIVFAWVLDVFCASCDAQPVLDPPAPSQLAFSAAELDAYAERTFGDRLAVERDNGRLGCHEHCSRLSDIFQRLARAAGSVADAEPLHWQLAVGSNPRETAWALAGGRVYISEPFIDDYSLGDDELAFVLAHEMGHVLLQHENEALTVAAAFVPRAVSGSVDSMYAALDFDVGLSLKLRPELQAEEFEADRAGLLLAGAAGFDPNEMLKFLRKLADRSGDDRGLLAAHPSASERWHRALAVRYSAQVLRARSGSAATH
jgi:Zn-dependent protease with chaperone function